MIFNSNSIKAVLLTFLFALFFADCQSQDVNVDDLLKKVHEKVSSIKSAVYEMTETYSKINIGEDTVVTKQHHKCYFDTNVADTVVGYKLAGFMDDGHQRIYNGTLYFENTPWNKKLTITDPVKFPSNVKGLSASVLLSFFRYFDQNLKMWSLAKNATLIFAGFENVNNERCYKLQVNQNQNRLYFFISEASYLPIKTSVVLTSVFNKATMLQIFDNQVASVKLNIAIDQSLFTKSALAAYDKEVEFANLKETPNELLATGTTAPDWELPSIRSGTIKLSDLAGKIVIMDFWYKACIPCQRQMLDLEKLHHNFNKDKVVFIGVNTIDDPVKDKLKLFLTNRNITMPSVYNGKKIESSYKVVGSPVLYIIGKTGKVLYALDGYSNTLTNTVTRVVNENL
jgi:peroxiredoxin